MLSKQRRLPMLSEVIGGRYHIVRYLGGGGFGQTYLAEDQHLPGKPQCVVKKLMPRVNDARSFEVARRLFDREAEVLYALGNHDQIPQLFAHFEENREFYLVQQYIEGMVLSKELKSGRSFDEPQVIDLLSQILSTLSFVHTQQVIHRDIKPSNLIRRQSDQSIVMIDFGGVKQIETETINSSAHSTVTVAIGSSGYMPNEQLAGKPRFSSDIYAVGMVGIQILTGCAPAHLPEDLRTGEVLWRDRAPHISDALAHVLDGMTRYDYRQRYQSATDTLAALHELPSQIVSSATVVEISRRQRSDHSKSHSTNSLGISISLEATSASGEHQSGCESDPPSAPSWASELSKEEVNGYLAWYERADELFQQQRYQKAAESYGKVLTVIPEDMVVWFKLAMALENCQKYKEAVAAYTQVIQDNPDDYLAWYRRGKSLEEIYQFESALESFNHVIQIQPENYWVWHDRGQALEALKQFDAAIDAYDRAVQIKSDFQLAIDSRRGLLQKTKKVDRLYHLQHYEDAIASCDHVINENPDDPTAWLMRGMALENSSEYKEAAKSYHQVTKLQPDNCWAWNDYGRVLETLHEYEEALEAYDQAARIRADFDSAIEGRQRVIQQIKLAKTSANDRSVQPVGHAQQ